MKKIIRSIRRRKAAQRRRERMNANRKEIAHMLGRM